MAYALADVTHLRQIYLNLDEQLKSSARQSWVEEEMQVLLSPDTYVVEPDNAWKRVKTRTTNGQFLAIVRELARFRESYAQTRNVPRSRVFKDDVILELASTKPKNMDDLGKSRLLQRDARKGEVAASILEAIKTGLAMPSSEHPDVAPPKQRKQGVEGLTDLLRVLLKANAERAGVAQKLIATSSDLDALANDEATNAPILKGWRFEVFGADAMRLKQGEVALSATDGVVRVIEL